MSNHISSDFPGARAGRAAAVRVQVQVADYRCPEHARAIVELLDAYAQDPMGGGQPLSGSTREQLVPQLARLPHALTLLAYAGSGEEAGEGGEGGDRPPPLAVGVLNAFLGFSTFKARPLFNVHDLAVLPAYRGQGVGRALLDRLEQIARERGCCKVTLEVLSGNEPAMRTYRRQGFAPYDLGPRQGIAQFWQKWL